jgi:ABC-2 type transport system permease protein
MRLFVGTLRKLPRRQATYITFGFLIALLLLIYLAIGASANTIRNGPNGDRTLDILRFPGAYNSLLSFLLGLGGLVALCYSAAIAGSEWQWGTLRNAVARGEGRVYYVVVTFIAIVVLVGIGLLISFLIGILIVMAASSIAGVGTAGANDPTTLGQLPEKLLRGWLAVSEQAAIGFAIATLTRSQFAGVVAGIALSIVEPFATLFLPDVIKYAPFEAAGAVLASSGTGGGFGGGAANAARLSPDVAVVVVIAWLLGSMVLACAVTERAEIAGAS